MTNGNEPDWLDPANDRKTPYTEEELELFAEGFIDSFEDEWAAQVRKYGEEKARKQLIDGFRKQGERNILDIGTDS